MVFMGFGVRIIGWHHQSAQYLLVSVLIAASYALAQKREALRKIASNW